jgi:hypothetical protein
MVPRGLEDVIATTLTREANNVIASMLHRLQQQQQKDEDNGDGGSGDDDDDDDDEPTISTQHLFDVTIWNQEHDQEIGLRAQKVFHQQQEQRNVRKQLQRQGRMEAGVTETVQPAVAASSIAGAAAGASSSTNISKGADQQSLVSSTSTLERWFPHDHTVGSVEVPPGQHISLGYSMTPSVDFNPSTTCPSPGDNNTSKKFHRTHHWSCVGQLAGTVWMQIDTSNSTISQDVITPSRYLGPLLGLITVQTDNRCLSRRNLTHHTAQDMTNEILRHMIDNNIPHCRGGDSDGYDRNTNPSSTGFAQKLQTAIRVWKTCVATTWRDHLSSVEYQQLEERMGRNQLRFRISCIRHEPTILTTTTVPSTTPTPMEVDVDVDTIENQMGATSTEPITVDDTNLYTSADSVPTTTNAPASKSRSRKRNTKSTQLPSFAPTDGDEGGAMFSYGRQNLCRAFMDTCGPYLVPDYYTNVDDTIAPCGGGGPNARDIGERRKSGRWMIDMKQFDIEFVIVILPSQPSHEESPDDDTPECTEGNEGSKSPSNTTTTDRSGFGRVALGISLVPYSYLKSRSFAAGSIPPDVTKPYLGGNILSGIVRLRPTTAHALLALAALPTPSASGKRNDCGSCTCDVILDPCAGIGTIPIEADQYFVPGGVLPDLNGKPVQRPSSTSFVGLGGDLVLNNPSFMNAASALEWGGDNTNHNSSLLVAWDAAHLPIRSCSIDAIVSDLPFGQQCLSSNSLNRLLPLLFWECARVLVPTTGRMVLLCGGAPKTLLGCVEQLSGRYWRWPCQRVSPVSIGGLLAWIVRIERNDLPFVDNPDTDESYRSLHEKVLVRVRTLTAKRERVGRQRKSDVTEQTGRRLKRPLPHATSHA